MGSQVEQMRVGGLDLLVEVVTPPGSEQTSGRLDHAGQKVVGGFDRAEAAIEAIATRLAGMLDKLAERAVQPDRVEVQFGLKFTAEGGILVAGSSVEASLQVTIGYDRMTVARASLTEGGAI
jgi:hypothetical protein